MAGAQVAQLVLAECASLSLKPVLLSSIALRMRLLVSRTMILVIAARKLECQHRVRSSAQLQEFQQTLLCGKSPRRKPVAITLRRKSLHQFPF